MYLEQSRCENKESYKNISIHNIENELTDSSSIADNYIEKLGSKLI